MDLTQLSQQVVQFLAPVLPFLLGLGGKAAEEAAKKLGTEAWEQAKALWGKLKLKVETKPAAQEAVQEVAAHPEDEDALAALRLQLRKLLAEDEALAREVQQILEAPAVRQVIAQGARSIAIGGDVSGNIIVTGDQNMVQQRQYNIQGKIQAGRDIVMGDQHVGFHYLANIHTQNQFVEELRKFQEEIAKLRRDPTLALADRLRVEVVQLDIQEAMEEARKPAPLGERINQILTRAKETLESLTGSVNAAMNLAISLAQLATLALKLFGP